MLLFTFSNFLDYFLTKIFSTLNRLVATENKIYSIMIGTNCIGIVTCHYSFSRQSKTFFPWL